MSNDGPEWLDAFLFWDLVCVAGLCLADWLLGETRREAMRERAGEWWLHVQEISFAALVAEDARKVRIFLVSLFGDRWLSLRCFVSSALASAFLSLAVCVGITFYFNIRPNEFLEFFLTFAVPNSFFDWLSISLTVSLLKFMERSTSPPRLLAVISIDAIAGFILGAAVVLSIALVSADPHACEGAACIAPILREGFEETLGLLHQAVQGSVDEEVDWIVLGAVFTGTLPTLCHLLLTAVFLGSKVLRPSIQRPVSALL